MKVLPRAANDADLPSSAAGLKLTRVPPPSLSLRPEPILGSSLSFWRPHSQHRRNPGLPNARGKSSSLGLARRRVPPGGQHTILKARLSKWARWAIQSMVARVSVDAGNSASLQHGVVGLD
jgi:hypothetical protein